MKPGLARHVEALPPRALTADENRALERAIGLSLSPQERLEWLERTLAELAALRGLAAGSGSPRRPPRPHTARP
ncbi:MAG TPA: hypothetical protein VLA75_07655 [Thermoanaerobaculia bacterium]|nr:hypothetical protein [Thermoanaerobaculia bacterium]